MKRKIAYIFPGQGSQHIGMLSEHLEQYPLIKNLFDKSSVILNYDLYDIVYNGKSETLNQTIYTQPALFIVSFALYQIHQSKFNISPDYLAGHSLGEYTALACAKALQFEETVYLVSQRAQLMQDAVPSGKGGMAAIIGLEDDKLVSICQEVEGEVSPANYNSKGQTVISGEISAVKEVMSLAKQQGAKLAKLLPVSIPSHSKLMEDASRLFEQHINNSDISMPEIPVISNVTANVYNSVDEIKDLLIKQLYKPVQWIKSVERIVASDINTFVECGPGNVLSGLNKRISKEIQTYSGDDISKCSEILNNNN